MGRGWLGSERSLRSVAPSTWARWRLEDSTLIRYVQPRLDRTDYPTYRSNGWQIGTGMIESTAKQLVGIRLKGPGMHWSHDGATAITALRAQDLNGLSHKFWKTLAL